MRQILAATLLAATPAAFAGGGYALVWEDQFDDIFVNPANWEFLIGDGSQFGIPGWGNNELQYYTNRPINISTHNGELSITAQRENFNGHEYTSARIRTAGRFSFRYGRVEARIKLPVGEGLWPAFWMMPEDSVYGGWPLSGEIDIMEASTDAQWISGAIHFGNPHQYISQGTGGSFGNSYHVYAVEWDPGQIRWYVDGQLFMSADQNQWFTSAAPGDADAPFDQPFHILLNMAVGGNFVQDPTPSSPFPKTMKVDWVRVYQQQQTPFFGVPQPVPGRVEAEDFDNGYDGQAYSDTTTANEGGAYRPDSGVDIEASSEGGFNVGWIREGEWIEYTLDVQQAGTYRIDARVASQSTGGAFRLLFDGQNVGATFGFNSTGGWQNWTTRSVEVDLPAGETVLRFVNLGGPTTEYNLNWLDFSLIGSACPADLADPVGVLDLADISAFSSGFIAGDPIADLAAPFGVLDLADINAFVASFLSGCP